jgi:hypothetical protein
MCAHTFSKTVRGSAISRPPTPTTSGPLLAAISLAAQSRSGRQSPSVNNTHSAVHNLRAILRPAAAFRRGLSIKVTRLSAATSSRVPSVLPPSAITTSEMGYVCA